ncbi:hypothetical protein AB0368_37535 [Actinoplanes sp. NPDC051475]|uniref:hypothetical protein n=1 Tax=Actinoplanes sp. NPDC051475 TaxID=3157225 RepID=UPI00344F517B
MISTDDLRGSFTVPFEHGLLVLEDPATRATHDGWVAAAEQVHLDQDSLYVGVQASVDGPVTVEVYDAGLPESATAEMTLRFSGELPLSSRILRVSDSDNLAVLSLQTNSESVRVRVLVDDDEWPALVVIILE